MSRMHSAAEHSASAEVSALDKLRVDLDGPEKKYNTDLKAPIITQVNVRPRAPEHQVGWRRVLAGDPVEVAANDGAGFKVMTINEYTAAWKRNDDFPDCLACGSLRTREHHFRQEWCRGTKSWTAESLCLDCHCFSWRAYTDPGYMAPEDYEKFMWCKLVPQNDAFQRARRSVIPA